MEDGPFARMRSRMHEIGVMQGRLVPQVNGRIQAFPWKHWQDEFFLAQTHGFQSIEFVFEAEQYQDNPIYTDTGTKEVRTLIERTGVIVSAVCADYFMDFPFFRVSAGAQSTSIRVLKQLIERAATVGAARVEIPCVDHAAISGEDDKQALLAAVSECLDSAERHRIQIAFETSLPPDEFREFLERFQHPLIRANYDTGNSASLGYEPSHEIPMLGNFIANIHIKDRLLHGTTVPLGSGNADFPVIFDALAKIDYQGPFILQTARDPHHVEAAVHYRDMVRSYLHSSFPTA